MTMFADADKLMQSWWNCFFGLFEVVCQYFKFINNQQDLCCIYIKFEMSEIKDMREFSGHRDTESTLNFDLLIELYYLQ